MHFIRPTLEEYQEASTGSGYSSSYVLPEKYILYLIFLQEKSKGEKCLPTVHALLQARSLKGTSYWIQRLQIMSPR